MMIFSLVAMTELEKCCITSVYLQWLCQSGERPVARGPLVLLLVACFLEIRVFNANNVDPNQTPRSLASD